MLKLRHLSIPVITAVNGAAAGIGYALAVSGDLIIAAESAKFVLAFSKIGLAPDGGVSHHLVKTMGRARAMQLALLDEKLPASLALEWGLINQVVADDDVLDTAMKIATGLANGPTRAYAKTRELIWQATEISFEELLAQEAAVQKELGVTQDHSIGVKSFLTKQPPQFLGK